MQPRTRLSLLPRLKLRVESRMALVDISATQSDNLLDPGQLEELVKKDLLFRDRADARQQALTEACCQKMRRLDRAQGGRQNHSVHLSALEAEIERLVSSCYGLAMTEGQP